MLRWKIEIEKRQGRYRPIIFLYAWIEGQLPDNTFEYENPFNINTIFMLPIFRLPRWKSNSKETSKYQRTPKLPFTVWDNRNPNNNDTPSDICNCQIIGGTIANFFTPVPHLLRYYHLDWIPNTTPETYNNIIQFFIDNWMLPLEKEYNKRLTEAINSQAFKITKTNDNNNDNNNNNQSKVTRKIKT